jgi:hypothetical protein
LRPVQLLSARCPTPSQAGSLQMLLTSCVRAIALRMPHGSPVGLPVSSKQSWKSTTILSRWLTSSAATNRRVLDSDKLPSTTFYLVLIRPQNRCDAPVCLSNHPQLTMARAVSRQNPKSFLYRQLVFLLICVVKVSPVAVTCRCRSANPSILLIFINSMAPGVATI